MLSGQNYRTFHFTSWRHQWVNLRKTISLYLVLFIEKSEKSSIFFILDNVSLFSYLNRYNSNFYVYIYWKKDRLQMKHNTLYLVCLMSSEGKFSIFTIHVMKISRFLIPLYFRMHKQHAHVSTNMKSIHFIHNFYKYYNRNVLRSMIANITF